MEEPNINIGNNIRIVMRRYGLTQQAIADDIGTTRQYLGRLLVKGNAIPMATLLKIADAIGCSVFELIDTSLTKDSDILRYCPYCGKKLR